MVFPTTSASSTTSSENLPMDSCAYKQIEIPPPEQLSGEDRSTILRHANQNDEHKMMKQKLKLAAKLKETPNSNTNTPKIPIIAETASELMKTTSVSEIPLTRILHLTYHAADKSVREQNLEYLKFTLTLRTSNLTLKKLLRFGLHSMIKPMQ